MSNFILFLNNNYNFSNYENIIKIDIEEITNYLNILENEFYKKFIYLSKNINYINILNSYNKELNKSALSIKLLTNKNYLKFTNELYYVEFEKNINNNIILFNINDLNNNVEFFNGSIIIRSNNFKNYNFGDRIILGKFYKDYINNILVIGYPKNGTYKISEFIKYNNEIFAKITNDFDFYYIEINTNIGYELNNKKIDLIKFSNNKAILSYDNNVGIISFPNS